MGHSSRSLEESSTENSSDCGAQLKRFQRGIVLSKWARDGCDFFGKCHNVVIMWVLPAHGLRTRLRLNGKEKD